MGRDPFSGIVDSFEDASGSLLISLLVGIFGMIVTILANVAIQMNVPEAASWTLKMWSLYLLIMSIVDIFGVFALGIIGLFASLSYVVGRIIGYAVVYWLFSLIQQVITIIKIPTTPILLNILFLFMLLIVRVSRNGEPATWW